MSNKQNDILFQLIKSLDKNEKRNFKLFVNKTTAGENLIIVQLFDALDKMDKYNEPLLLKKNKSITKQQLSNTKSLLYKKILLSLRPLNNNNVDIYLHEQLDFARILYNKGLYLQSLKTLSKLKSIAKQYQQISYQQLAVIFEKKIEALHITRSIESRAEQLSKESWIISNRLLRISKLSNLSLELYSWYIQHGHVRDESEVHAIKTFFETNIPHYDTKELGFYEKLYLYQSYCWYGFIRQDLLMYYRYTKKWVDIFDEQPDLKIIEAGQYIRGLHNLLNSQFDLNNYEKFIEYLKVFEDFSLSAEGNLNSNIRIQIFIYLYIAKINKHFIEGTFTEGLQLVPFIEEKLKEYRLQIDKHHVSVFYYKIACLYFGSGNNEKAIDYLNKIINWKADLRADLQCYARLLHLIAHYELGNESILEYLIKSVYRFMFKMKNLSTVEEEIFKFIRRSFSLSPQKLTPAFISLKEKLEKLRNNPFENRSFMYLDIISWLQCKIENVPVQEIIHRRFLKGRKN